MDSDFVVSGWPQLSRGLKQFGQAVGAGAVSLCQIEMFFQRFVPFGMECMGRVCGSFF